MSSSAVSYIACTYSSTSCSGISLYCIFFCRGFLLYKGNFVIGQFFRDIVANDSVQNTGDECKGKKYRQKFKEEFLRKKEIALDTPPEPRIRIFLLFKLILLISINFSNPNKSVL